MHDDEEKAGDTNKKTLIQGASIKKVPGKMAYTKKKSVQKC